MKQRSRKKIVDGIVRPKTASPVKNLSYTKSLTFSALFSFIKIGVVSVIVLGLFASISISGSTTAYFSDNETSTGNSLRAGTISFNLSSFTDEEGNVQRNLASVNYSEDSSGDAKTDDYEPRVGKEEFVVNVLPISSSLPLYYNARGVLDPLNEKGCELMMVDVSFNDYHFYGFIKDFFSPNVKEMGQWKFIISLPESNNSLTPNAECNGSIAFKAGLLDVDQSLSETYTDEKHYTFELYNWNNVPYEPPAVTIPELVPENPPSEVPPPENLLAPENLPNTPVEIPADAPVDLSDNGASDKPVDLPPIKLSEPNISRISEPDPSPQPSPQPPPPPSPLPEPVLVPTNSNTSNSNMIWGAYVGDSSADINTFENLVGQEVDIRSVFYGFDDGFPVNYASTIGSKGKTLLLFWESSFGYDSILNGSKDAVIKKFAEDAKTYGYPVMLSPFHEMNGNWSPWSGTLHNNTPAKFIDAWKHIHNLLKVAPNVKFALVYNSNSVPNVAGNQFDDYYPGAEYVDYVGLDGFNFGTPWLSFKEIFDAPIKKLAVYNKPIYIFSMGSVPDEKKAEWIKDALGVQIHNYPIVGWIWFNQNGHDGNWLVNSDPQSLEAFKSVIPN